MLAEDDLIKNIALCCLSILLLLFAGCNLEEEKKQALPPQKVTVYQTKAVSKCSAKKGLMTPLLPGFLNKIRVKSLLGMAWLVRGWYSFPCRSVGTTGIKLGCSLFLALLLLLSSFQLPAGAEEPETITWLVLDLPPLFITKGPDAGNGIADRIQKMIIKGLKGRHCETRVANASRIAKELNQDSKVCFAGEFYGNPAFLTSIPTIVLPPHNLIVLKENAHLFGDGDRVSLRTLLQNEKLIFGTAENRLYGPELDAVLKEYAGAKNIYARSGKDTLEGLLGMLDKKRVHYIIEYPVSIRYAAEKAGIWERLAIIPIEENAGALPVRGAVRCPDTPWGHRLIKEINEVLLKIRPTAEYRKIIKDWIVTPGLKKNTGRFTKIRF